MVEGDFAHNNVYLTSFRANLPERSEEMPLGCSFSHFVTAQLCTPFGASRREPILDTFAMAMNTPIFAPLGVLIPVGNCNLSKALYKK